MSGMSWQFVSTFDGEAYWSYQRADGVHLYTIDIHEEGLGVTEHSGRTSYPSMPSVILSYHDSMTEAKAAAEAAAATRAERKVGVVC